MKNDPQLQRPSPGERTALTGQQGAQASDDVDAHGKRKLPPLPTGSRFKAVGTMVLAMKRFQASLNPTVTFGKPSSSAGGSVSSTGTAGAEATSTPQRGPQNPANRGKLQRSNTPNSRNRMALVFTPLPDEVNA
jgi:hypothetical protein